MMFTQAVLVMVLLGHVAAAWVVPFAVLIGGSEAALI